MIKFIKQNTVLEEFVTLFPSVSLSQSRSLHVCACYVCMYVCALCACMPACQKRTSDPFMILMILSLHAIAGN